MNKNEELILKSYLLLPNIKLLYHEYESKNDYLAGHVSRFLKGERFDKEFKAFTKEESDMINSRITNHIYEVDGIDLLNYFLTVKLVCNILNKYRQ